MTPNQSKRLETLVEDLKEKAPSSSNRRWNDLLHVARLADLIREVDTATSLTEAVELILASAEKRLYAS